MFIGTVSNSVAASAFILSVSCSACIFYLGEVVTQTKFLEKGFFPVSEG